MPTQSLLTAGHAKITLTTVHVGRGTRSCSLIGPPPTYRSQGLNATDPDSSPRTEQLADPFRPGNGVAPPYLAGRDALLAKFKRYLGESHPPHANWTLTGIRGTGKTVLLGEFATRGERAGWLCLGRELSDRHRDDARLADAIADDCAALIRRRNSLARLGDAIERAWQYVRPRRLSEQGQGRGGIRDTEVGRCDMARPREAPPGPS